MLKVGLAGLATVASLLAACAPNVRTVSQSFANVGGADDFAQEVHARDVFVTVRGSAFGLDQTALNAAVVARMQGNAWGANPRFTADRGPNASTIFSVVFVIGAPGSSNPLALCANPDSDQSNAPVASGAPLHISGALCRFGKTVTAVEGYADRVGGVEDPQFGAVLAAATRDMTREQRPNRFRRDD